MRVTRRPAFVMVEGLFILAVLLLTLLVGTALSVYWKMAIRCNSDRIRSHSLRGHGCRDPTKNNFPTT